jgi:cardiolipin synthase
LKNCYRLLAGAGAFLPEVERALAEARKSCFAQFMTFEGDESGLHFSRLLAGRVADGLDVRLMVDRYTDVVLSDVYPILLHRLNSVRAERARTREMFDRLRSGGVPVRRTAPPGPLLCYMLYRDHKKMVVIDNRVAFVGGINISDHNYAWHDFMVRIEGPLVEDLARDFLSTWDGATVPLTRPEHGGDFVLNQCAGRYSVFEEVLALIEDSRRTLVIESPYLIGDRMEGAILAAAQRGVAVTLIVPYRSNKLLYRIWVRSLRHRLAHPNVSVHGYRGNGGMTHAKLLLVDGCRASFGSFNMMELEGLTQKELNIFTRDQDFVEELGRFVAGDVAQSVLLPPPRWAGGRFTYAALHGFFRWWTGRLLKNPAWRRTYC